MIKLKNLWKVALATMAMSAMLVACDSTSNTEDEVTPGTYTAGTGVYELKAPKDKIGRYKAHGATGGWRYAKKHQKL